MCKTVIKLLTAGCGLCLIGWKQQAPSNQSSPKSTVRYFVASVVAKNADAVAACVRGAKPNAALQAYFHSDTRPSALMTNAAVGEMIAEGDANHARVAAEIVVQAPANSSANGAKMGYSLVEMFQLEREGDIWRIVPDAEIEKQMEQQPLSPGSSKDRYLMRPFAATVVSAFLPAANPKAAEQIRQATASAACLSNAKQIALGLTMYLQDHDEVYPPKNALYGKSIAPYVKNADVFTCPLDAKGTVSYTMNPNMQAAQLAAVMYPARTVLVYEGKNRQLSFRHDGKAVVAFADGHAKLVTPAEAKTLYWYPNGKTAQFEVPAPPSIKSKPKSGR